MKKIMIAFAAAIMAIGAQAAAANWYCTAANIYDGKGESAAKWAGTAYIYALTATVTQDAIWESFANGDNIASSAIVTATVSGGALTKAGSTFTYGEQGGNSYSYFLALVDGDNILLTKTVTQVSNGTATEKSLAFGSYAPTTGASSKSLPTEGSYTIGAWATAAVPEPTSGLLMLLGMAGLALRRRRA